MKSSWISRDEACDLTGWTVRHLRRLASAGTVESRDARERSSNGQPRKEYALASLPEYARLRYLDGSEEPAGTDAREQTSVSQSPLSLALPPAVQEPIRVALKPDAEAEAARRIAILKPLIEYLRDKESRPRYHQLALAGGEKVSNSDSLVRHIAERHQVSAAAIWRWKAKFEGGGSFALARKPRADKNRSSWAADNRELADLAALVYMGTPEQPAQSKRVAWEQVCERAERMGLPSPSYETVRAFLGNPVEVSPSMLKYGREGRRKYDAQFAPYISRSYTEPAYSIIVSDHRIHDVLVQDDVFNRDLKHIRVQTTTLEDLRSRFIVGWACTLNGSSHSIKHCLRQAWQRFGLFDRFYCDNGKDYRKVGRGSRDQELEAQWHKGTAREIEQLTTGVLERVNIPTTFCIPFHPQSKPVERFHDIVRRRFDMMFPTYTGSAPHLRPDATNAALARHGKLLQMGRTSESALPLASDFIAMYGAWIENWYHQQPQDGRGMDGRTPAEVFEAERGAARPCPEPEILAMLMCERVSRKVANMQVQIDKDFFVADHSDAWASFQMHERSGSYVTVAYDPLDAMVAYLLDDDGNYICRVQRKDLVRFSNDQETRDQIAVSMQHRNGLRKAVRDSIGDLNRRVRVAGYSTLVEQQREHLQLPHAVGENVVQSVQRPEPDSGIKETHSEDNAARYFERMKGIHGSV